MIGMILWVFAFVFFCVAAVGLALPRVSFGWLGLAFFTLGFLLGGHPLTTAALH